MPRPAALVGKKRTEALAQIAAGDGDREIGRRFGVSHKTISKMRRDFHRNNAGEALKSASRPDSTKAEPAEFGAATPEDILESDLKLRLELRDGLISDFRSSPDPRERTLVAKALESCLDGLRKVVSPAVAQVDEEEDVEADAFDSYMLRAVQKARVAVAAGSGVSSEAQPPGAVGDSAGASGTNG